MKYYPADLVTHIKKLYDNNGYTEELAARFILHTVRGLKFLHHINVIHGDMALRNLLMDDKGNVVIADFGLSHKLKRKLNDEQTLFASVDDLLNQMNPEYDNYYTDTNRADQPFWWIAPEVLDSHIASNPLKLTFQTDNYMLGSTISELLIKPQHRLNYKPFCYDKNAIKGLKRLDNLSTDKAIRAVQKLKQNSFVQFPPDMLIEEHETLAHLAYLLTRPNSIERPLLCECESFLMKILGEEEMFVVEGKEATIISKQPSVHPDAEEEPSEIRELREKLEAMQQKFMAVKLENERVKSENSRVKSEVSRVKSEVSRVKSEVSRVKTESKQKDSKIKRLENDVKELRIEAQTVRGFNSANLKLEEDLESSLHQVRRDIDAMQNNRQVVADHLDKLILDKNPDFKKLTQPRKSISESDSGNSQPDNNSPIKVYKSNDLTPGEYELLNSAIQSQMNYLEPINLKYNPNHYINIMKLQRQLSNNKSKINIMLLKITSSQNYVTENKYMVTTHNTSRSVKYFYLAGSTQLDQPSDNKFELKLIGGSWVGFCEWRGVYD